MAAGWVDFYRRLWGWWSGSTPDDTTLCYTVEIVPQHQYGTDLVAQHDYAVEAVPQHEYAVEVGC